MKEKILKIAEKHRLDPKALTAFIMAETGGKGFVNGKIVIQFEPAYFKKREPFAPSGAWSINKVDVQVKEWQAFNNAFAIDANSAMESTSIGLGQIMGAHWQRLGYSSVGAMWDFAKASVDNQIEQIALFIKTDKRLLAALQKQDWHMVASIYNGAAYKTMAVKWGREPYNETMKRFYDTA
jgi:hypothetical protein